jgi:hypothetical protein
MSYARCPVPISLVRSSSRAIAIYDNRVFICYDANERKIIKPESFWRKPLVAVLIVAALIFAALLLGVAATS